MTALTVIAFRCYLFLILVVSNRIHGLVFFHQMEISKELLYRYHNGTCTVEEKAAVEGWLEDDTFSDEPGGSNMPAHLGQEMWTNISSFADNDIQNKKIGLFAFKRIAIAATLLLVAGAMWFRLSGSTNLPELNITNVSHTEVKNISNAGYRITMAPNSNLRIDANSGVFRFCGSLLFSPKKDMELSFAGLKYKVKLKTGQTYIVLSTNCPSNKPIIINEKDVYNLPPVMQRQLSTQFSI